MNKLVGIVREPGNWLLLGWIGAAMFAAILTLARSQGFMSKELAEALSLGAFIAPLALVPFVMSIIVRRHGGTLREDPGAWLMISSSISLVLLGLLSIGRSFGWIAPEVALTLSWILLIGLVVMTPVTMVLARRQHRIEMAKTRIRVM